MTHPTRLLAFLFFALLAQMGAACADDGVTPADAATLQEKAQRLRGEAAVIRSDAEARNTAAQKTCWKKFLVSGCLADSAKAMRDEKSRAYAMDKEAREIERNLRKQEFAAREARRLERQSAGNPQ